MALAKFANKSATVLTHVDVMALAGFWKSLDDSIESKTSISQSVKGKSIATVKFVRKDVELFEIVGSVHDIHSGAMLGANESEADPKEEQVSLKEGSYAIRAPSDSVSESVAIAEGLCAPDDKLKLLTLSRMKNTLQSFVRESSYGGLCGLATGSAVSGRNPAIFLADLGKACPSRQIKLLGKELTKTGKFITRHAISAKDQPISYEIVATYPKFITMESSEADILRNAAVKPWSFAHAIMAYCYEHPSQLGTTILRHYSGEILRLKK